MDKMIMEFHIETFPDRVSELICPTGKVKIIPFTGWVESDLFSGKCLPGAADVQTTNACGIRHMCAQYMFEGKDYTGAPCKLFVSNNGYFEPNHAPKPFFTCPTLMTDSSALAEYFHQARFRGMGKRDEEGLHIYIYDVCAPDAE